MKTSRMEKYKIFIAEGQAFEKTIYTVTWTCEIFKKIRKLDLNETL